MLAVPGATTESVESSSGAATPVALSARERALVASKVKYRGYIEQQLRQVEKMARDESRKIPVGFDYHRVPGLSREIVEKLSRVKPLTLGQASRISGITPAAVALLRVYVQRPPNLNRSLPIAARG
jgi:tRNA uridine 5-carboxymethylaminomethyl modification enzyme